MSYHAHTEASTLGAPSGRRAPGVARGWSNERLGLVDPCAALLRLVEPRARLDAHRGARPADVQFLLCGPLAPTGPRASDARRRGETHGALQRRATWRRGSCRRDLG